VIVVDASVVGPALIDEDGDGERFRARLAGERLAAPALIDLEVLSAWRGISRSGRLSDRRAERARAHLAALPLARASHGRLMNRIWDLRDNLTSYDAAYVALAEFLQTVLVTADSKLAGAPGIQCEVELLPIE
jgi:predicted nucleic acid-binding protein